MKLFEQTAHYILDIKYRDKAFTLQPHSPFSPACRLPRGVHMSRACLIAGHADFHDDLLFHHICALAVARLRIARLLKIYYVSIDEAWLVPPA